MSGWPMKQANKATEKMFKRKICVMYTEIPIVEASFLVIVNGLALQDWVVSKNGVRQLIFAPQLYEVI